MTSILFGRSQCQNHYEIGNEKYNSSNIYDIIQQENRENDHNDNDGNDDEIIINNNEDLIDSNPADNESPNIEIDISLQPDNSNNLIL